MAAEVFRFNDTLADAVREGNGELANEVERRLEQWLDQFITWQEYTPSWAATGVAPVLGNGTLVGQHMRIGNLGFVSFQIVGGTTTTWGTGAFIFGMPSGWAFDTTSGDQTAVGFLRDTSTANDYPVTWWLQGNETAIPFQQDTVDRPVTSVSPFTFATGDSIRMGLTVVRLQ